MRTKSLVLAVLIFPSILLSAARAQPAFMVKDIGDTVSSGSPLIFGGNLPAPSGPGVSGPLVRASSVELDGVLYFGSNDGVHGGELWRSDGTSGGTRLLQDVCPGVCSSFPDLLTPFQHKVYWIASVGAHFRLMASDGTPRGTVPFLDPASPAASLSLIPIGEAGGRLLLAGVASDQSQGELWATDGTADGTVRLRVFPADPGGSSSRPILIGRAGGALVFKIASPAHGETLWATAGTADGTRPLMAEPPGMSFYGGATAGGRLFFEVLSQSGEAIWVSDGTPAGTQSLADVSFATNLTAVGSQVFFTRSTGGEGELWKSDGTLAGTVLVKTFISFPPNSLTAAGSRLFFLNNGGLWVSDGTAAGTLLVRQFFFTVEGLAAFGDRLAFFADDGAHGLQPWISDGTAAGTYPVADIPPPHSLNSSGWGVVLGVLGDRWLFASPDSQGWFLWSSDGTPGGLARIRRLDVQTSSFPRPWADLDGTLLFSAYNQEKLRQDLWRTDGSAAGTTPVVPGTLGVAPFLGALGQIGGRFFYASGAPGVPGPVPQGFFTPYSLWTTDGTAAGARQVTDTFPLGLYSLTAAQVGGSLYVQGASPKRSGLFKTDGTAAGTVFLHRFDPNTERLSQLLAVGDRLFFLVGFNNPSLWTSDGTVAGTKPVLSGHTFLSPIFGSALGSRLFFTTYGETERELWTSDGTATGTYRIAGIGPRPPALGTVGPGGSVVIGYQAVAAGRVLFVGDDGVHGPELWSTDGTAAGTHMVVDIFPGASGAAIGPLTVLGRRVYFAADDGAHGRELWTSDGTAAGTRRVADIAPGAGSSQPSNLTAVDGRLLFSADDGVHGVEPWVSDGTTAGTRMLQDIAPGPLPSSPSGFLVSGGYVYFSATDAVHGFELWAVPRSALRRSGE